LRNRFEWKPCAECSNGGFPSRQRLPEADGIGRRSLRILTVNAGSTSLKLERYELDAPLPPIAEPPDAIGAVSTDAARMEKAIEDQLEAELDAVSHRVVRLPDGAPPAVKLDVAMDAAIRKAGGDAPLHDEATLHAAEIVRRLRPSLRQFGIADGAFHHTLSAAAATYAIPRELTRRGFRRLGYHGLSHEYAAHRGAALAGLRITQARIVSAHVGGGSSLCAIENGASIDTTMGYTPLEGLPMTTRSGSVDPGLLLHLLKGGMPLGDLDDILERHSGLLGISGRSGDVRELLAARAGDPDAALALDVLGWRLRAAIGAMVGVLGGVDLLVFTGGIGEHAAPIRAEGIRGVEASGVKLDAARNTALEGEGPIGADDSQVAVFVVRAREGWQLARAAAAALAG
jgi:acetate kinase